MKYSLRSLKKGVWFLKLAIVLCFGLFPMTVLSQDISLFKQFNGRHDFVTIGNTLNIEENGVDGPCIILTGSSAALDISAEVGVIAAYLYWAGSGVVDPEVMINGQAVTRSRTFSDALDDVRVFFSAFADVTDIVRNTGNGVYTFSGMDLNTAISPFCTTGTNFGGWAIVVVLEGEDLPVRQLNVYDGLQSVPTNIDIALTNLNVIDTEGAKIGFLAWEGDDGISVNESLRINGNSIGNPPLNPENNAFNGTNSFTGASDLYNMDIDFYNIQDNIAVGDTEALIQLSSGQDFVMVNNIITVLSSLLPDANVQIDEVAIACDERTVVLRYAVSNLMSTQELPDGVPITIYANDTLLETTATSNILEIGDSEAFTTLVIIPESVPDAFTLRIIVDEAGEFPETDDSNNEATIPITIASSPVVSPIPTLVACDEGFDTSSFDLTGISIDLESGAAIEGYYESGSDAVLVENAITFPENYTNASSPQVIYLRIENVLCFTVESFTIEVENCPPFVPRGFSPNADGFNDTFEIPGLKDVFEGYRLLIYNRYGIKVYEGDSDSPDWDGSSQAKGNQSGVLPVGTYFYVLDLNDAEYEILTGWVYLNR